MHCVISAIALSVLLGVGTAAPHRRSVGWLSPAQASGCSGYCGGFSPVGSCYCDDLCTSYGDCCSDYHDFCKASCLNSCGGQVFPGSCWCDDLCTGYQDCCPDYEQLCASPTEPLTTTQPPPSFEQFIVFSKSDSIYRIELDGSGLQTLTTESGARPWGVDFDIREDYMYWADINQKALKRSKLDGSSIETLLTLSQISEIAVDWINKKVYYNDGNDVGAYDTESGTNQKLFTTEQLARPLSLAVDPNNGYLYWTEGGYNTGEQYKRVVRANLDGTGRQELHNTGLLDPEGLSVDYSSQKIYWGDPLTSKIERSNTDGSSRETVISTSYPTSTAVLGDTLYYTENSQYAILTYNLQTSAIQNIHQEAHGNLLSQLTVVSVDRQPEAATSAGLVSSRPFPALISAVAFNGHRPMVGSRPPTPVFSANRRYEAALNNGVRAMEGTRPPPARAAGTRGHYGQH